MPDVTVAPALIEAAADLGMGPAELTMLSQAISEANRLANDYALSLGIPVMDRYHVSRDFKSFLPWTLGGHTFTSSYAPDNYHPATVVQGLMGNMVSTAFNEVYGLSLPLLSDQEIVSNAGYLPDSLETYFDVSPYVLLPHDLTPVPEVSSWLMLGCLMGSTVAWKLVPRNKRNV
ncbi:MAG: hypothetical protein U1D30_16855 [Planctomycetota bacterium]